MKISHSDKALLITISGACLLVLVFFFLGVKPYQGDLAEEFIEIPIITEPLPKEEKVLSEQPEIRKRRSNQAYNSSQLKQESNSFEQEDKIRKAIEDRQQESVQDIDSGNDARLKALQAERNKALALQKEETQAAINARELKRKSKKASKYRQSTISYNLKDRTAIKLPNPVYTCDGLGTIVINITVNSKGTIVKKVFNTAASSSSNGCLIDQAMQYLENAYFDRSSNEQQLGSVTFIFQG